MATEPVCQDDHLSSTAPHPKAAACLPPLQLLRNPRLAQQAPVPHFDLLLSGMAALQDELRWFAVGAADRCVVTRPHGLLASAGAAAATALPLHAHQAASQPPATSWRGKRAGRFAAHSSAFCPTHLAIGLLPAAL